jgi:hypothetical protein
MSENITKIPAPRTPLIDENSGDMTPAWYRFFYNIFITLGEGSGILPTTRGGTGQSIYSNGQLLIGNSVTGSLNKNTLTPLGGIQVVNGPGTITIENTGVTSLAAGPGISVDAGVGDIIVSNTGVLSAVAGTGISVSGGTGNVTFNNTGVLSFSGGATGLTPSTTTTGNVVLAGTLDVNNGGTGQTSYTDGQLLIGNTTGNTLAKATLTAGAGVAITNGAGAITIATSGTPITSAPTTKTADFSVGATDTWIINNKSGSTCTVTLPSPSANTGRVLYFQNYQAQFLVSASSNVVPRAGGSAGTALLADVAGDTATLVSDGTNWITMQYTPNNVLLI